MVSGQVDLYLDVMNNMEKLIIEENRIYLKKEDCENCRDKTIMSDKVRLYEEKLAELVSANKGSILEIGFGLGISATKIQSYDIEKHVIIEKREEIYKLAEEWAKDKNNVQVIHGDWIDILPIIGKKFDGIYNDADQDDHDKLKNFPSKCKSIANDGCLLFMTSWANEEFTRELPHHILEQDEEGKKVFGESETKIPYATYKNNQWT